MKYWKKRRSEFLLTNGVVYLIHNALSSSPLRDFLQKSMLSSDDDSDDKDNKNVRSIQLDLHSDRLMSNNFDRK